MRTRLAPLSPVPPPAGDAALAGGLLLLGVVEALMVTSGRPAALLPLLALAMPLAWRASRPAHVAAVAASGLVVQLAWSELRIFDQTFTGYGCLLVASYSLGRHGRRPWAAPVLLACALAVAAVLGWYDRSAGSAALGLLFVLAPAAVGRSVELRFRLTSLLERQQAELEEAAALEARAGVVEVRGRIAGDVQEVVSRRVQQMVEDARRAQALVASGSPSAPDAVAAVEEAGRAALDEMRGMLGVLRQEPDPPAGPLPGHADDQQVVGRSPERLRQATTWAAPVVGVVAVVEAVAVARRSEASLAVVGVLAVVVASGLLLSRRRPVAGSLVGWAALAAWAGLFALPVFTLVLAGPLLAYVVGARTQPREAVAGVSVGVVGVAVVNLVAESSTWGDFVFPAVLVAASWQAGRLVRRQGAMAEQARDRAAALERAIPLRAAAAAAEERLRIARELHDVLAHTLMVMVVQAGAARRTLERGREGVTDALVVVQETGRGALAELRRLLSLVDPDGAEPRDSPGLRGLPALVEQVRAAGIEVELTVEGTPSSLPGGLELAAYRVVQEALTNVVRHAHARRAWVRVDFAEQLGLEIRDDGRGGPPSAGAGNGISGMRERAALYGGALEAGPVAGGGFRVSASFPVGEPGRPHAVRQEQQA